MTIKEMTISQIVVGVWQQHVTPREALEEIEAKGYKIDLPREDILELLEAVSDKEMNVTAFLRAVGCER